jgi:hypothetical protein
MISVVGSCYASLRSTGAPSREVGKVSPEIFQRVSASLNGPAQPFSLSKANLKEGRCGRRGGHLRAAVPALAARNRLVAPSCARSTARRRPHLPAARLCRRWCWLRAVFFWGIVCRTTSVTDNGQTGCLKGCEASPTGGGKRRRGQWAMRFRPILPQLPGCRVVGGHVSRWK